MVVTVATGLRDGWFPVSERTPVLLATFTCTFVILLLVERPHGGGRVALSRGSDGFWYAARRATHGEGADDLECLVELRRVATRVSEELLRRLGPPGTPKHRDAVRLRRRLHRAVFRRLPAMSDARSPLGYTVGKRTVAVCVPVCTRAEARRAPTIAVLLHELAHLACRTTGHGDEFRRMHREIVDAAVSARMYDADHVGSALPSRCGAPLGTRMTLRDERASQKTTSRSSVS
jgi:hypothetical protein